MNDSGALRAGGGDRRRPSGVRLEPHAREMRRHRTLIEHELERVLWVVSRCASRHHGIGGARSHAGVAARDGTGWAFISSRATSRVMAPLGTYTADRAAALSACHAIVPGKLSGSPHIAGTRVETHSVTDRAHIWRLAVAHRPRPPWRSSLPKSPPPQTQVSPVQLEATVPPDTELSVFRGRFSRGLSRRLLSGHGPPDALGHSKRQARRR